jgi:hypothetical protein
MGIQKIKALKSAGKYGIVPAATCRILSTTPMPHIQSLHGIWIYSYGLEASKSYVYSKARES